ncbi:MAG: leucyl/phenylalanyl-tRNA--protein transferase [Sphingobacteriales bacterium 41-5]|nr:MAG: leucyl/phenylalanyl-tRNA--protein transferase [Sphingobacteriales bacterium 41-5]
MAIFALDDQLIFPPVHLAEPNGLLAIGGDLSTERLLLAYRSGIFPWYDEPPILWWSPDPRFVLFPDELKITKSLKPLLNRNAFKFTTNRAFKDVIRHCRKVSRPGQDGTWINENIIDAFVQLHEMGYAHSAEVWQDDGLVGGLYGIKLGKMFFGESMFSLVSNASRYAFAKYVQQLKAEDIGLIDCQIHSEYLESMGARMIGRAEFQEWLSV